MDQNYFEDEFEQFLRDNADQHRMYPSDGVWSMIYRQLHAKRRRIALGAMLFLAISGIVWLANIHPVNHKNQGSQNTNPQPVYSSYNYSNSSVTVDDIIAKLKAKSLIPPIQIEAPKTLSPLRFVKPAHLADTYTAPINTSASLRNFDLYPRFELLLEAILVQSRITPVIPEPPADETLDFTPSFTYLPNGKMASAVAVNFAPPMQESRLANLDITPAVSESAKINITSLKPALQHRFSFLMSFSPSIGYRNMIEGGKQIIYGSSPLMVRHLNVNQFVAHQPAMGFELAGGIRYQLTRSLAIRTGLQFNLTRYSIAAFAYSSEKATVSLNTNMGYLRDTLVANSNVRNLSGDHPERLRNEYLQIALPVGAELKLFGDSKLQLNLAGSLQPVYLLNTNQNLLSSDYTNYIKEPSLIRRWNMASSLEAFVSYKKGDYRWQIGPQFRYNLLSTYKSQYPIKENLMEYGLKIGFSKTIR